MLNQKLLIIDDSEDIRELVQLWLSSEPVEFAFATDGEEGLRAVAKDRPDLILLDVDMPTLNGFEVCRRLKADVSTADIPIVFLTGASSTEEKLHGLELGAVDYVTKPFDPAELRARVRSSLQTKRLMNLLAEKALTLQESEERFRVLAENSSDVISRHTLAGTYLYVSPAATTILGWSAAELEGKSLIQFVHPDDLQSWQSCWAPVRAPDQTGAASFRFRKPDGTFVWLEMTCRSVTVGSEGLVREIHASSRDITQRRQMEDREIVRADILEMIAHGRPLQDVLNRLIIAVEAAEPNAVAAGVMLNDGIVHHCAPHLPKPIASSVEKHLYALIERHGSLAVSAVDRVICSRMQSDEIWADLHPEIAESGLQTCWSVLIRSRHREVAGVFSVYRRDVQRPENAAVKMLTLASDLTSVAVEQRQLNDLLTFQAHHDTLTQLPNRSLFQDRLHQALAVAKRSGASSAVMLIDVDRFKHVNDTFGHQAGDEMLCQVAKRLRTRLRASDTLARMGGDEFAIILNSITAPDDAAQVAKNVVSEFQTPVELSGRKLFVTVSIGTAVFPRDGSDPLSLLKNADLALYQAKDAGRNAACSFAAGMGDGAAERMEMETALREAVKNNELLLHYQPKVSPVGYIVGVEALLRWQHPKLGLVPPGKFIPLAEDTGLIVPIGSWVIAEAVRQQREWVENGLPMVPVAVNVSARQFAQPDFVSGVANVMSQHPDPAPHIELELTESLLMHNVRDAVDKLAQLRAMNIRLAIDDFGTGYSSLAYLQRLAIDTLKIDHSFVSSLATATRAASMPDNGDSSAIITAIVAMARSLNLHVVAEGVETDRQRHHLLKIGCDTLQGYLFSPAVTPMAMEGLLRRQPFVQEMIDAELACMLLHKAA